MKLATRIFELASSRLAPAFGLLAVAAVLSACGGDDAPPAAGETDESPLSLKIAIPASQPDFTYPYIAEVNGYFQEAGVDVEFVNDAGGGAASLVTSGRADVTMFGTPVLFFPAFEGRSTTMIYNFMGGGQGGLLAVRGDSEHQSVDDLAGQRIAVLGVGGSSYGFANQYSSVVTSDGGSPFNIIPLNDPQSIAGGVRSGQFAGAVGPRGWFSSGLDDGSLKLLIDTTIPTDADRWVGGYEAETAIWGLTENLESKREAVTRFLVGIARANEWVQGHTPEEIADALQTLENFKPLPRPVLVDGLDFQAHFWTPYRGHVNKELWDKSLDVFRRWQIEGLDLDSPEATYERRVDMSYLKAALERADLEMLEFN